MNISKIAQEQRNNEPFQITSVCRADLEQAGFDASNVGDGDMAYLASKMANAYCDSGFWESLEVLAEHLDIKKHKNKSLA